MSSSSEGVSARPGGPRWGSFHLNTPNWCTQLPGLDLADADPDAFAPLDEVVDLLAGYATRSTLLCATRR